MKRVISLDLSSVLNLKSVRVLQGMSLLHLNKKLAKLRPLIFFLIIKAFGFHGSGSALSRSAFFVNQVTCIWALTTLMALVELGQQKVSVQCDYVCFGAVTFLQIKGTSLFKLSSTMKITWVSLFFFIFLCKIRHSCNSQIKLNIIWVLFIYF